MSKVSVFDHPMIAHKLTLMRCKETGAKDFRDLLSEISMLMAYEITRDLPTESVEIETPICKTTGRKVLGKKLAIVPILRAIVKWEEQLRQVSSAICGKIVGAITIGSYFSIAANWRPSGRPRRNSHRRSRR